MNFTKRKSFTIILVLCILFVGSLLLYNFNFKSVTTNKSDNKSIVISNTENSVQFNSANDLIKYADNVIVGSIVEDNEFSKTTREYTFLVEEELKGSANSSKIKVYETNNTLNLGKKYILFLESSESTYFPETSYTSLDKDAIIEVDGQKLVCKKNELLEDYKSTNDFVQKVKTSPSLRFIREKSKDIDTLSTKEDVDVFTKSDCVYHIIPTTITYENKYIKSVKVEILKSYKGEFNENWEIILPSDIEIGNEYIVFLKKEGNTLTQTTKNKSVIRKNDTNWSDFINKYEK
ncbi:hypothetical protein EHE19_017045 [Ruminiclostridium herbifermentans]|uniref:Uncharacterized protein n=1 Tax=Ruminiclostridium herbifermentans TaxID=2488810 RepID=A0A4U7J712_9FIRM|nr:hypothetical protein [Ruminiclostridium herbifermentans]QNU66537.1 hypothetical protein EHE19_017045 [Ruminiclostridium herbifermentans]